MPQEVKTHRGRITGKEVWSGTRRQTGRRSMGSKEEKY